MALDLGLSWLEFDQDVFRDFLRTRSDHDLAMKCCIFANCYEVLDKYDYDSFLYEILNTHEECLWSEVVRRFCESVFKDTPVSLFESAPVGSDKESAGDEPLG